MRKVFIDAGIPDFYWDADTNTLYVPPGVPVGSGGGAPKFTPITPPDVVSDQDDYDPSGLAPGVMLRLNPVPTITVDALNPSDKSAAISLSNSDRTITTTSSGYSSVRGLISKTSGKWYIELEGTTQQIALAVATAAATLGTWAGSEAASWAVWTDAGVPKYWHSGAGVDIAGAPAYSSGRRFMLAIDFDAGLIWPGYSGTWVGNPSAGTGAPWSFTPGTALFILISAGTTTAQQATLHAGQDAMTHTVPTGFATGWYDAASLINLTGISADSFSDGDIVGVMNLSSSIPLVLKDEVTSSPANQLSLVGDVTLSYRRSQLLMYDGTLSRFVRLN